MKITGINYNHYLKNNTDKRSFDSQKTSSPGVRKNNVKYLDIPFGSLSNVHAKKKDAKAEKHKLQRQIDEILAGDIKDSDLDDMITSSLSKALGKMRACLKREKEILHQLEELVDNKTMTAKQKVDIANALNKEYKLLKKNKLPSKNNSEKVPPLTDEKMDYRLINKFKQAVAEDKLDLKKVYDEYYADLKNIKTIRELSKKYPKIKTPANPRFVIAKKIESTFTRDFYEGIDELFEDDRKDEIFDFVNARIQNVISELSEKFKQNNDEMFVKLAPDLCKIIIDKYSGIKQGGSFNSVPEFRKNKTPLVTETDMKLLSLDFNDFVLSVVRSLYIDSQKLNNIVYSKGNIVIPAGMLKNSDYKFEKVSEKIKRIISSAENVREAQRDYKNFEPRELKDRLNYYATKEISNNEELLEHIIDFDACLFTAEDIELLIKFLQELDLINDGKKTPEQSLCTIKEKDLRPKGTEKLNEIERQKAAQKYKEEQQKTFKLNKIKAEFDDAVNILYANNLNNIALTCAQYRPENLEEENIENAHYIINAVKENLETDNETLKDKKAVESHITRWDTFISYKKEDMHSPIFKKALSYAVDAKGVVDIDKAGKYILNSEIVENAPESLNYVQNSDVYFKVLEKALPSKEKAVESLCRFDDYQDLPEKEKTQILKILDIFDQKNPVDKAVLKHIIENEYCKTDTEVVSSMKENSEKNVLAIFAKESKQQIVDKYKFPICIEYLSGFEDALSSYATERGTSGIKKTNKNNKAQEYEIELKLMGHDDRLFSSKNDYRFDVFSEKGLH